MRLKLASALIAALLVFGLVFGVGQAAAASLPGGPLYGLKLTAEQARVQLTTDPEAKAELAAELAENRLGEIAQMVSAGEPVDGATAHKAQQQLSLAFQAANQVSGDEQLRFQAQNRLRHMIQSQYQEMASAVDATPQQPQEPVRDLLRSMERVRAELHTGEGDASGQQNRSNRDEVPQPTGPVGEPGAGTQAGQGGDDGLLDASGETGTGAQGGQTDGQGVGPEYGPGPQNQDGPMGPYEGDGYGPGSDYGPGPAEPQDGTEAPAGPFGWLLKLFKKDPTQGSGSSGGTSGSGNSGGTSGSGSSGNGSSGSGTPGGKQ